MKFNELDMTASKSKKRVGRGISAGRGKTAGRGTKGQNARKSGGVRPGFEGGQNPLMQRIPKLRGFTSHRAKTYTVYTGQINALKEATIDVPTLAKHGLVSNDHVSVKLVVKGEVSRKMTVKIGRASASAVALIEKAGGTFTATERIARPAKSKK
jgi:large subunit ribosomal protein L15